MSAELVDALRRRLGARLVETHISWVLLAGDDAWKIKKPVQFGFLDFSTLDARRRMCDEELRLNRRLAPALYLDVVPIGGTPQAPALGAARPSNGRCTCIASPTGRCSPSAWPRTTCRRS